MSVAATDPAIRLKGVTVAFGARSILAGLDLAVPRGKNVAIMGLSGSGKSVMLKTIAGLLRPQSGEVEVNGVRVDGARRRDLAALRANLGFLFQNAALLRWMTTLENVALPLTESGVPREEAVARARKRLDDVGLADAADKFPDEISGGMAKRVGFCRASVTDPAILLYDEPTTGLDPITKSTIDELIVRGRDQYGATGVIVSHDLRSAIRTADFIALLYEGTIQVLAPPKEFLASDHEVVREFVRDEGSPRGGKEGGAPSGAAAAAKR